LKSMGASELRKSCLDDVPTCNSICGKRLPCGTHHCKSPCHQGPCNLCQVPLIDICVCGKGQRKKKCYELKYPIQEIAIFGEELMREIEDLREQPFRCVKKCSQIKSCKKHRCQAYCCPAERGNDPDGVHLCVNT